MLKKLSEAKLEGILEAGIEAFSSVGPDKASISAIAKKAGVSVGVIYKYYSNKDDLFRACLDHALIALEEAIDAVMKSDDKILVRAEKLIRALQKNAKSQSAYNVLYHEITAGSCKQYVDELVPKIEGISAKAYSAFLEHAKQSGDIRQDIDPNYFAFFFDSMLMMLQFSYSCDYYKARFKLFCGADVLEHDERVVEELLKFFESAFTTERSRIEHRLKRGTENV